MSNKVLEMPSLTKEQTQELYNFAMNEMPTKWGTEIIKFIEKVAIELDKAQVQEETQVQEVKEGN